METQNTIDESKHFWFADGRKAASLDDMKNIIKDITEDTFRFHVNDNKNDIAEWIKNVIKDKGLSEKLKKSTSHAEHIKVLTGEKPGKDEKKFEIPSLNEHLKRRRVSQINQLLDDINYKIIHHSDILDKYEKVREHYKKLDKKHKQEVYSDVVKTYNKMQEIWGRINY